MSATKRIDGDYSIVSSDGAGNSGTITLEATGTGGLVYIPGDLTIDGTTTTVNATDLNITDKVITVNDGETASPGMTGSQYAGIAVDRGAGEADATAAKLLWDEANSIWIVNLGDGGSDLAIVTGAIGAGSGMLDLIDDLTPQLGGNLDTRGLVIETSNLSVSKPIAITVPVGNTNNIELTVSNAASNIVLTASGLNGEIILAGPVLLQGGAPNTTPAGTEAALFKAADTGGGTQVHYQNDTDTGELVSKSKAIMYSLIF